MPNISISQMDTITQANLSDLHEVAVVDAQSQTGYKSGKETMEVMANAIVSQFTYSNLGNKTVKGAVDDAATKANWNNVSNKPTLGTASALNVAETGNATDTQVVKGNDTRLSDSRPASDVYPWAKADTKPTYSYSEITNKPTVDTELDSSSANAISNSAVTNALDDMTTDISDMENYVDDMTQGYTISTTPYITDASATNIPSLIGDIEPVQDLHGYSYPWVGGAGVNKINAPNQTVATSGWLNSMIPCEYEGQYYFSYTRTSGTDDGGNALVFYSGNTDRNAEYLGQAAIYDTLNERCITLVTLPQGTKYIDYYCVAGTYTDFMLSVNNVDFAPYSNICPITGYTQGNVDRCGVNLFDKSKATDGKQAGADGTIQDVTGRSISDYISVTSNTAYYVINAIDSGTWYSYAEYDKFKNFIRTGAFAGGSGEFTTSANTRYVILNYVTTNADTVALNHPSTVTDYVAYQATTLTANFNQTVYSGHIDWISGDCVLDMGMVDLGDLDWTKGEFNNGNWRFATAMPNDYKIPTSLEHLGDFICSNYTYSNAPITGNYGYGVSGYINTPNIYVMDMTYTDATTFKSAMSGVQLLYELATPITLHLTPQELKTLKGTNNFTTNLGGGLTITYQPDNVIGETKAYTEKLNELTNAKYDADLRGTQVSETEGQVITIDNSAECYAEGVSVDIKPIQDLHGFSYPWVGGAGKNLLEITTTSGSDTGIAWAIDKDTAGNVISLTWNGKYTGSGRYFLILHSNLVLPSGTYWLTGAYDAYTTIEIEGGVHVYDTGTGVSFTTDGITPISVYAVIYNNRDYTNVKIYPMIRLTTVTDPTFAPYTNICPISGYDDVHVATLDDNTKSTAFTGLLNGTYGVVDLGTLTWTKTSNTAGTYFYSTTTNIKSVSSTTMPNAICTNYSIDTSTEFDEVGANNVITISGQYICIRDSRYNSVNASDFKTAMNGVYLIYELETPITPTINKAQYETLVSAFGGHSITATFNDTVYSGHIDFTSGVATLDMGIVDLGDLTWTYVSNETRFYAFMNDTTYDVKHNSASQLANVITSQYLQITRDALDTATTDGVFTLCESGSNICAINIRDTRYTDASTFTTAMSGVQLLYELATPITVQFTAQQLSMLKGYNTVTTDANNGMEIKWQPDNVVGEIKGYASRLYKDLLDRLD